MTWDRLAKEATHAPWSLWGMVRDVSRRFDRPNLPLRSRWWAQWTEVFIGMIGGGIGTLWFGWPFVVCCGVFLVISFAMSLLRIATDG